MPLNVGDRLGPYAVTAKIGEGGMGEVYRAHDTKLDRDVAVKVLPDKLANDAGALRRFQQEARAVAALNHPNVVTIHAVGESDGVHFLAMELVEGRVLSELIGGEPLSLGRFFEVSVPLADALATAHDEGITHRDLKPANVMITAAGRVKVLDFGLAKFVGMRHELEATLSAPLTEHGAAVGTFPYMSPEQLEAKVVDHRSDIFSLGVVMYELIAGCRPFVGDSGPSLASAILRDDPPSLAVARAGLPAALVRLIGRCLEKVPDRRYQSAAELRRELEATRRDHESGVTVSAALPTRDKAIAVLPFTNMSADPENEFFSDGISEEIINALGRIEHLHVAARTSAFSFKGQQVDLRDIGTQLNVHTVLEGSVRRAGTRLRITAQLVNVADGYQVWSERYDRELEDVFAIQDEIARTIVERLKVALIGEVVTPMVKAATANLEAYELYLRGRALLYRRGLSVPQALECFTQAVALDPDYAQAWTGLADAHTVLGQYGFAHPATTMPQAKAAALRAVELDDTLAEAHGALGGVLLLHDWDPDAAERALARAVALNPRTHPGAWLVRAVPALVGTRSIRRRGRTHDADRAAGSAVDRLRRRGAHPGPGLRQPGRRGDRPRDGGDRSRRVLLPGVVRVAAGVCARLALCGGDRRQSTGTRRVRPAPVGARHTGLRLRARGPCAQGARRVRGDGRALVARAHAAVGGGGRRGGSRSQAGSRRVD